ncbi:MAG: OmpA family protein [Cellulophaga sp.]
MKNKLKGSIISFLMLCFLSNAQKSEIKKAENSFNQGSYTDAIIRYKRLINKGNTSEEAFRNLGDAYYYSANYIAASTWYKKLFELETVTTNDEYIFRYAMSLKSLGEYEKSDQLMVKFSKQNPSDSRAQKFLAMPDYLQQISEYSGRVAIKNMALNSNASDFAPSINKNRLIFASARDSGLIASNLNKRDNKPFHKLYVTTVNNQTESLKVTKFSKQLDTKAPETTTVFSKDGKTLYFTRNSIKNGNFSRDKDGLNRTKIYRSRFMNGKWSQIEELPFNGNGYSVAHPALSPNEKKLYFASDMPGTIGLSDLFSVELYEDGTFGQPINLGSEINTSGRDTFPFVSASNTLYFASDGQIGLGGLDVFATQLNDKKQYCIVNIGTPINSKADDFAFIIDEKNKAGYFSSNREGGQGDDDIYSFNETIPLLIKYSEPIQGFVRNIKNGEALANTTITVFNSNSKIIGKSISDDNGRFKFDVKYKSGTYQIITKKEGFQSADEPFTMAISRSNTNLTLKMTALMAAVGTNLIQYLNTDPVLFKLNEHTLSPAGKVSLSHVADYILKFPETHISIHAHTDASGAESYNLLLSSKRAKSTMEYLIQLGVNTNKLTYKGFGETQLLHDCNDLKNCTHDENQKNRRSECIVSPNSNKQ